MPHFDSPARIVCTVCTLACDCQLYTAVLQAAQPKTATEIEWSCVDFLNGVNMLDNGKCTFIAYPIEHS